MNEWQALRHLRFRFAGAMWPTSGEKIWGASGCIVSAGPLEWALTTLRTPFIKLAPGAGQHDPTSGDEYGYIRYRVVATSVVSITGDATGQNAILGANRTGGEGKSAGMGLLEVQEQLYALVKLMSQQDGITILLHASSEAGAAIIEPLGYIAFRDYELELDITSDRDYPPARSLTGNAVGGGQVAMFWKLPAVRFDLYRVRMRRAAGSTPPATITDGVEVSLDSNLDDDKVDSPGAGTFSYSIFACYDDRNVVPSADVQFSSPTSRTFLVT